MSEETAAVAEATKPKAEVVELKEVVKEVDKESLEEGTLDQGNDPAPTQSSSLQTPDIPDRTPSEIVEDEKTEAKAGAILKGVLDAGDDVQHYFDGQLEAVNIQMCCFSLLGFCLVIVYNDHCFDFENTLRFTDNFEVCASVHEILIISIYSKFLPTTCLIWSSTHQYMGRI